MWPVSVAAAKHIKNEEIFLENYATVYMCVCLSVYILFLVKTTLRSKLETKIEKKKCHAATAWVSQTDTHFYDTRTSGGCK